MRLTIAIPESHLVAAPAMLRLIRMAQTSDMEADDNEGPTYVACFEDFPQSADVVGHLMEWVWDLEDIRITVDGRLVASPVKFYNALCCYRESLDVTDALAYCAKQAAKVGDAGGCPDRACLSHCQFMCSRCLGLARERGAPPISVQLQEIARQAEVNWCPNLRIAKSGA